MEAQDLIDDLLRCCPRTYLYYDENGWNVADDASYNATAEASFGSGDGYYENIIDYDYTPCPSKQSQVKDLIVKYQYNPWETEYPAQITKSVNSFGEDKTIELPSVRDGDTADYIAQRLKAIETHAGEHLRLTVGTEGRGLDRFDPINVVIKWEHLGNEITLVDSTFQIMEVTKRLDQYELECRSYSSSIYTTTTASPPTDPESDGRTDWSNTHPDAPTSLSKDSSGTYQGTDGGTKAYFELSANAPAQNLTKISFGYRKANATIYSWVDGDEPASGNTWSARIDGLTPGIAYDFIAMAVNAFNLGSLSNPTLSSQTAPGDSTAPATPTGLSATGKIGGVEVKWTANSESDFSKYILYRSTYSFGGYGEIARPDNNQYTDPTASYGTTYYYKASALDYSKNESSLSSYDSASPLQSDLDDDITDGTNYARVKGIYLTSGQYKLGSIYQAGETLTISSGKIKITGTDGLEISSGGNIKIDTSGGLVITASDGLTVNSTAGIKISNGGFIRFFNASGEIGRLETSTSLTSDSVKLESQMIYIKSTTYDIHLEATREIVVNSDRIRSYSIGGATDLGEDSGLGGIYGFGTGYVNIIRPCTTTHLKFKDKDGTTGLEIDDNSADVLIMEALKIMGSTNDFRFIYNETYDSLSIGHDSDSYTGEVTIYYQPNTSGNSAEADGAFGDNAW
jgi:hypothetical protein